MLSALIEGVEYSLDDGSICTLVGYSGWGQLPTLRYTSRGPEQDGDTDVDMSVEARIGTIALMLPATELNDMYTRHQALHDIFSPLNTIILKWAMPYGDRYIETKYLDGLDIAWNPRSWAAQKVAIQLRAADPTFYDLAAPALSFGQSGGGGGSVPTPVPTPVGASTLDESYSLAYVGKWHSYPSLIRITGPITDAVIENVTLGYELDFTGHTIATGHYVDIDLRYAHRTVKYDGVTRWVDYLTTTSDLSRWRISPAPKAPDGINVLRVSGTSVNSTTRVDISYQNRYTGI